MAGLADKLAKGEVQQDKLADARDDELVSMGLKSTKNTATTKKRPASKTNVGEDAASKKPAAADEDIGEKHPTTPQRKKRCGPQDPSAEHFWFQIKNKLDKCENIQFGSF